MGAWQAQLRCDPLPPLLSAKDVALRYWARRDLLGQDVGPAGCLWGLPAAQRILRRQLPDGSWPRPGKHENPAINQRLIETWRQFRFLVEQYGFTREHPQARQAAEYLFSCQTPEGDIRGILANQCATYYTGAILALLIQAGYAGDPRVDRAFGWLLAMRQDDGGWTIPLITHKLDRATQYRLTTKYTNPVEPDRSKPFSHNWTGMVLRAFAVHLQQRHSQEAWTAAHLLKSRFFQPDCYTSYQAASYWVRFEYPFWWNNLVAALDSLSRIGLPKEDSDMARALAWLAEHQEEDGLWRVTYAQPEVREGTRAREMKPWVSLAICRVFRRLHGE